MSSESQIQTDIRLKLSEIQAGVFLRYQVGTFLTMDGRPVKIGVPGTSDLIGIVPHVVTAGDVGKTIGVFCAIETKKEKDSTSKDRKESQGRFLKMVNRLGGIGGIARSVADAVSMVTEKWKSAPVKNAGK
jgi:hypothetical protein